MKMVICGAMAEQARAILEEAGHRLLLHGGLSEQAMEEGRDAAAIVVRSSTMVSAEVMDRLPALKVIGRPGAGIDNVDVKAATQRGIVVMNTPGGNAVSVAEHALALMLALSRDLVRVANGMKRGEWLKKGFEGRELAGKTLALIGLGKVGAELARRARGLGMTVVAYDPFVPVPRAEEIGVELLDLEEALERGDVISLHAPATPETEGLLNAERLAHVGPGALLVNTARGNLVDGEALREALDDGRIAAAALDVFVCEPPPADDPLVNHPRVLATPHVAGASTEGQTRVGVALARQLIAFLQEGVIINAVNFPAVPESLSPHLRQAMACCRRLGNLIARLSSIRIEEIGLRYYGEWADIDPAPLTAFALAGVMEATLGPEVTPVNARALTAGRGIEISETRSSRDTPYAGLLSVQLRGEGTVAWVEGTVVAGRPRLVSLGGIDVECDLEGHLLVVRNEDVPGVVGQVGTELGRAGINIAAVALGRRRSDAPATASPPNGRVGPAQTTGPGAIGLFRLDQPATDEVLESLRALDPVDTVLQVTLPGE